MSSNTAVHRGQRARARTAPKRPRWLVGAIALGAIGLVAGLIVFQSTRSGGGTKLPPLPSGVEASGRVLGQADAPVTIVEYADFQCPVCKRAETSVLSRIKEDYVQQGTVKIEFRMFPFIGQESFNAAQAAEAAREQGKFWEYHDALFNAQGRENGGSFSYEKLVDLAKQVPGLDVAKFEETLQSNKYLAPVQQEADDGRSAGVASTPTFYIGDRKIVGVQSYATFQDAIDAQLAKVLP